MKRRSNGGRFAEREVHGVDDSGAPERIVIWIERRSGGLWSVGRSINPEHRPSDEPRHHDYVFEGHELGDALDVANAALRDECRVLEQDGRAPQVAQFEREELLKPLERWFFGAGARS